MFVLSPKVLTAVPSPPAPGGVGTMFVLCAWAVAATYPTLNKKASTPWAMVDGLAQRYVMAILLVK
jgi:hypothetical protein